MSKLDCIKPKPCIPDDTPKYPAPNAPFDLCVGDWTLHWDGWQASVSRRMTTPDGVYDTITMQGGCVAGYGLGDVPTYTPPYCNPNPCSCQGTDCGCGNTTGGGSGGSASIAINPSGDNILSNSATGLYAHCYIRGGANVAITGDGTRGNPYIISSIGSSQSSTLKAVVARNGLNGVADANGVYYIELPKVHSAPMHVDVTKSYTVDVYGKVVSVDDRHEPLVVAGEGITTKEQGDSIVVGHEVLPIEEDLMLGAYQILANPTGHIVATNRLISLNAGTYQFGDYDVTVNSYGSITGITASTASGGANRPLALIDMVRITTEQVNGALIPDLEFYGVSLSYRVSTSGDTEVSIALPSYVTDNAQISVNGDYTNAEVANGRLIIRLRSAGVVAVAFKG